MKTLDEALGVVCPMTDALQGNESAMKKLMLDFREWASARNDLRTEAIDNLHVRTLVVSVAHMVEIGEIIVDQAVLTGFVNGMFVGIEMEKAE